MHRFELPYTSKQVYQHTIRVGQYVTNVGWLNSAVCWEYKLKFAIKNYALGYMI
jgi:hypothetical protein